MSNRLRMGLLLSFLGVASLVAIEQSCGSSSQGRMDASSQVLAGNNEATDTSIHDAARSSAMNSYGDNSNRTGNGMARSGESYLLAAATAAPVAQGGTAAAPAEPAPTLSTLPVDGRKVVYTGRLRLTVANRETAHTSLIEIIGRHGGFIQHDNGDTITVRMPPGEFDAMMRETQGLGEIESREVSSEDVTESYTDLQLRIGVAEDAQKRLQALMDKGGKLDDLLLVEAQIRKLTEEIETMKGKLRFMASRIDLSTITVELLQRRDQAVAAPRRVQARFSWMEGIGIDGTLAPVPIDARIKGSRNPVVKWGLGPRFSLASGLGRLAPDGFVELAWNGERLVAATPEDWRVRATLVDVRQTAALEFWGDALKEELAANRGYLAEKTEAAPLKEAGMKGLALRLRTAFGGQEWKYDVWLIQRAADPDELLIVEFARTDKAAQGAEKKIEEAIAGVKLRPTHLWM